MTESLGKSSNGEVIVGVLDGAGDGAAVRAVALEVSIVDGDVAVLCPGFDVASAFETPVFRSDCRKSLVISYMIRPEEVGVCALPSASDMTAS
jgi:hypothetical protein